VAKILYHQSPGGNRPSLVRLHAVDPGLMPPFLHVRGDLLEQKILKLVFFQCSCQPSLSEVVHPKTYTPISVAAAETYEAHTHRIDLDSELTGAHTLFEDAAFTCSSHRYDDFRMA
jgi:hypothetical protein